MIRTTLVLLISLCLTACATRAVTPSQFAAAVQKTGMVDLTAWLQHAGELVFYDEKSSLDVSSASSRQRGPDIRYPQCISGVFPNWDDRSDYFMKYNKRKVRVRGRLVKWDSLEEAGIHSRNLSGMDVYNWCFGDNVLLLTSITLAAE